MIKIRRRKPIFEDDQTIQQQPSATGTTAQPAATPANNTTTPAAPIQPQQPAQQPAQPNNTNTPQQPADQNNQQQQQQPNPNAQKVADMLKKMENTWWMISVNLPDEIQKDIPDFKQGNQQADNAIKAWGTFKQNPTEDTFKQFLEGFKAFGGVNNDQTNNQQNSQQPAQPQQPAQQPAQPQTNVNAGLKAAYSFRKNLMENLEIANKKKYYNSVCEDYFDKTEFTL